MLNNPALKTYIGLSILLGVWVVLFAYYGSAVLFRPGEIDAPAYPLIAADEAAPEATAAAATAAEPETPAGAGIAALLAAADADAGAKISKKCAACHGFDKGGKNKVGPNLWDIVGRAKAGADGFKYSSALADLGGAWSYADLDAFLARPKDFAPGTKMSFSGLKSAQDRADLIAYLRGRSDAPKPLP